MHDIVSRSGTQLSERASVLCVKGLNFISYIQLGKKPLATGELLVLSDHADPHTMFSNKWEK